MESNFQKVFEEQRELRRLMHLILARGPVVAGGEVELPDGVAFPIYSREEMDTFDDTCQDPGKMSTVVQYLSSYCAGTVRETVQRILKETVTTQVAVLYNYHGKKGKLPFCRVQLVTILYRCLQSNPSTKGVSRKSLETEVQKWLFGARDRDGGRKRREGRPQTMDNSEESD